MGAEEHHHLAGSDPVAFHVIVVSTSRTAHTDRSGPLIVERIEAAGHRVVGRDLLPDDQATVHARLRSLQQQGRAEVVVLSGGTGLSAKDRTYEAVQQLLDKELAGFGEIFRRLSYDEIGSAAMMSRATAGLAGSLVIFALPGSPSACRLGLDALILPEAQHLLFELRKERAGDEPSERAPLAPTEPDTPASDPPPELAAQDDRKLQVDLVEHGTAEAPEQAEIVSISAGWKGALEALGATVDAGRFHSPPAAMAAIDPVRNVLESAGQVGTATLEDGTTYGLFGYPDLLRPASKVLLVMDSGPLGAAIALHRHPRQVGLAAAPGQAVLGHAHSRAGLERIAQEVTGGPWDFDGQLFAVEGDRVYAVADDRVSSWDGRRERLEGTTGSAMASLMLRWSQR